MREKIIYEKKNKKALLSELVDISKIYLFLQDQEQHILKSWKKYPDDIANVLIQEYEYISLFFTQAVNNKTISNIFVTIHSPPQNHKAYRRQQTKQP